MYYTREKFMQNSLETGPNITTGYIDRKVYEVNPLTHGDFKKYLDNKQRNPSPIEQKIRMQNYMVSDVVFNRIYGLLSDAFMAYTGKICNSSKLKPYISFQLFGADIAVNDQLYPSIMEINKGPDIGAKDGRDGDLKRNCISDMLSIVGLAKLNENNGFIKIVDMAK